MNDCCIYFNSKKESHNFQRNMFENGITWNRGVIVVKNYTAIVLAFKEKRMYSNLVKADENRKIFKINKLNRKLYQDSVQIGDYLLVREK